LIIAFRQLVESLIPTLLAHAPQLAVENIRRKNAIHNQLSESAHFVFGPKQALTEIFKQWFHQQVPRNVERVLFGYALVLVSCCHGAVFSD